MEDLAPERCMVTRCGHLFCKDCIESWVKERSSCPTCVQPIRSAQPAAEVLACEREGGANVGRVSKFGSKLQAVCEQLDRIWKDEPGAKTIIFVQFEVLLKKLEGALKDSGLPCLTLRGGIFERRRIIRQFQSGGDQNKVLLLSLEKSPSGMNLVCCHHLLLVHPMQAESREAAIGFERQAIGRVQRQGQQHPVQVYRFFVRETMEEKLVREHHQDIGEASSGSSASASAASAAPDGQTEQFATWIHHGNVTAIAVVAAIVAQMQLMAAQLAELQVAAGAANARAEAAEGERTPVIQLAASQVGRRDGDSIIDGRGVGQPFKFTGKRGAKGKPEQDFAEWSLKMVTFLKAKFTGDVEKVLKWASRQKKVVVDVPVAGDTGTVGYDGVFGEVADDGDRVENLDQIVRNLFAYLISFTTGDANKIVRNSGSDQGLEAWRRLNNEHDPTSSMRRVSILGQVQDLPRCEKDSLMAAMFKLLPKHLQKQLLFRTDEYTTFEDFYVKLTSYASTKHYLRMQDRPVQVGRSSNKDPDAVDVDALQRPGGGKGNPNMKWLNCGKPGHKAAECRSQPATGSGGGGAGAGKGGGKGKGFKGKKGKSKDKGKKGINGMESWGDESSWADDSWADDSWSSPVWAATEVPASQPGTGGIPLGACSVDATNSPYIVDFHGQEWIRFNYNSEAATAAIPFQLAGEVPLKVQNYFKVASGQTISDYGRTRMWSEDEKGNARSVAGSLAEVHKPLGSAAGFSKGYDTCLWEDGGALLPRDGPVAWGLRQECFRLVALLGDQRPPTPSRRQLLQLLLEEAGLAAAQSIRGSRGFEFGVRKLPEGCEPVRPDGGAVAQRPRVSVHGGAAVAWRPAEEVAEVEEEEFEESEEMKRMTEVVTFSARVLADHALENHSVYRNFCERCVDCRGLGQQRRRQKEKSRDEEREGPRISSDDFFMSTEEESTPILALKFSRSKRVAATALPQKGVTPLGVKFFARFIAETGVKRFLNCSDNGPVRPQPGEAIARYPRGADGKTPWEREKGTGWKKPGLQFGEQIFIKEAVEREGRPKRDWNSRMAPVRCVGNHSRTGAVLGLCERGLKSGVSFNKRPEDKRWTLEGWDVIKGLLRDIDPGEVRAPRAFQGVGNPAPRVLPELPVQPELAKSTLRGRTRIFQEVKKTQEGRIQRFRDKMSMVWERHGAEMEDTEALGEGSVAPKRKKPEPATGGEASSRPGAGAQGASSSSRLAAVSLLAAAKRSEHPDDPEETVADSLPKKSRWEKERHGVWKLKRTPENPSEELQAGSAAAAAMPEVETQVVLPPDVMMGARDAEDARAQCLRRPVIDLVELGFGEADVLLSRGKAELMELVKVQVENCFRNQGVDISEQETDNVAALQLELELATVDVMEIVRGGLGKTATSLGLRPGACLRKEQPYPVMGRGGQRLQAGAKLNRQQCDGNRYFLHEHHEVGDSRDDAEARSLQQLPGVSVVPTRWITNSQKLAEFLAQWSAVRSLAPVSLRLILVGLWLQMKKDSILSSVDLIAGGPVPSASVFDAFDEDSLQKALVEKARGEEIG
ncbi:unnamed protein product [Polarella glacialis]|uniref:RING-type domain-containing protein n=1 Tax=Polarella glacialis TaxID=89957 RepID=A0A813GHZ5_POLGL|nr:unnamed protein product [Polarella glacialis]